MPEPKDAFDEIYPCDFYTAEELLEPDKMYTVPEIARLLQGLDPDAEVDEGTEAVLVDWAIPWVMTNADDLVIGEPLEEEGPGYYGLATDATESTERAADEGANADDPAE
ncbi:DUF5827 family protein [Haloparvum sp. AD34]